MDLGAFLAAEVADRRDRSRAHHQLRSPTRAVPAFTDAECLEYRINCGGRDSPGSQIHRPIGLGVSHLDLPLYVAMPSSSELVSAHVYFAGTLG